MKQLKISHLFHWLYAILMLLPVFSVLFTCLYVCFNKNAKDSYFGDTINNETIIYTNDFNGNDKFYLSIPNSSLSQFNNAGGIEFTYILIDNLEVINNSTSQDLTGVFKLGFYSNNNVEYLVYFINESNPSGYQFYLSNNYSGLLEISFNVLGASERFYTFSEGNDIIYKFEYNKYSYLDNVFYYSFDQVANSDMFGWANNSFICEPFKFITGLFGVQSDNAINTYLSYWGSISIIWLVFDLVLYVPLLAHKWLDDGSI